MRAASTYRGARRAEAKQNWRRIKASLGVIGSRLDQCAVRGSFVAYWREVKGIRT